MQHALTVLRSRSCKTYFLHFWLFGGKISLIFPVIDLRSNLHIGLLDLVNPLIFADLCPGWHNYPLGFLFQFHSQLALKFLWVQMCFGFALILSYLNCVYWHYIMSTPVSLAHKEFNSLEDKIAARYEQLDSREFGAVGIPGFNAKSAELACSRANFVTDCTCQYVHNFTGCHSSNIKEHFSDLNCTVYRKAVLLCGGCSFFAIDLRELLGCWVPP